MHISPLIIASPFCCMNVEVALSKASTIISAAFPRIRFNIHRGSVALAVRDFTLVVQASKVEFGDVDLDILQAFGCHGL